MPAVKKERHKMSTHKRKKRLRKNRPKRSDTFDFLVLLIFFTAKSRSDRRLSVL